MQLFHGVQRDTDSHIEVLLNVAKQLFRSVTIACERLGEFMNGLATQREGLASVVEPIE